MEDEKYLELAITYDPFGKMGGGAPLRDSSGHILAERGNIFDRSPVSLSKKSPKDESED